jgi:hypothetical protein
MHIMAYNLFLSSEYRIIHKLGPKQPWKQFISNELVVHFRLDKLIYNGASHALPI